MKRLITIMVLTLLATPLAGFGYGKNGFTTGRPPPDRFQRPIKVKIKKPEMRRETALCKECGVILNTIRTGTIVRSLEGEGGPQPDGRGSHPDVAYDPVNNRYAIVWDEATSSGRVDVYAHLVDADGNLIIERRRISVPRPTHGCLMSGFTAQTGLSMPTRCDKNLEPSIAYTNGRFLIVWTLEGVVDHPPDTPFAVILGMMTDPNLEPVNTHWTEGRLLSKVHYFANRDDRPPANDAEIMSWSTHEKAHVTPYNDTHFVIAWQSNLDYISCVDPERWSSRSVYGRAIPFDFGPGGSQRDIFRIYSDRSNRDSPTRCASNDQVTTVAKPRIIYNATIQKFVAVFEYRLNQPGDLTSVGGNFFWLNSGLGTVDLDPWTLHDIDRATTSAMNPDVAPLGEQFLIAYEQERTRLIVEAERIAGGALRRDRVVVHSMNDHRLRRPRLLVRSNGEKLVAFEKWGPGDTQQAVVETRLLNDGFEPVGRPVDLQTPEHPFNLRPELADGTDRIMAAWDAEAERRGRIDWRPVRERQWRENLAPTARIAFVTGGEEVMEGATVRLTGTMSADPEDGMTLTYQWAQEGGGPPVTLATPTAVETSFAAPAAADPIVIALRVADTEGVTSEPVRVSIRVVARPRVNRRPTACIRVVGGTTEIPETAATAPFTRTTITFDGSCSDDGEPDIDQPLAFEWTPEEPSSLENARAHGPDNRLFSFTPPDVPYPLTGLPVRVRLTVDDGQAESARSDPVTATITILFVNRPPTVDLGADMVVGEGTVATLGARVADPDASQPVRVNWRQVGGTPDVRLDLSPDGREASFTAPEVGADQTLEFEATATDEAGAAASDRIAVTVRNVARPPAIPELQRPADGAIFPATRILLQWGAVEAEAGGVNYTVLFDTANPPVTEAPGCAALSRLHCVVTGLTEGTDYFWQVIAHDAIGQRAVSAIASLHTDTDLAAWWQYEERSGTIAVDSSGRGHDGTLNNFSTDPPAPDGRGQGRVAGGAWGDGLQFDGVDDYIDVGSDSGIVPVSASGFTWSVWYHIAPGAGGALLSIQNMSGAPHVLLRHIGSVVQFLIDDLDSEVFVNDTEATNDGLWHQAAAVFAAGENMSLYIDGELKGREDASTLTWGAVDFNGGSLQIGRMGTGLNFDGVMDDLAICNRALTQDLILNNFCSVHAASGVEPLPGICLP